MPERSGFVLANRREQMRVDAAKRDPAAVQVAQRHPCHSGAVIDLCHDLESRAGSPLGMFLTRELGAGNKVQRGADRIRVLSHGLAFHGWVADRPNLSRAACL